MTTVADVLALAADLLAERGWVAQRTGRSGDRRLTTLSAITVAVDRLAGSGPDSAELHQAALDAVCRGVWGVAECHSSKSQTVGRFDRQRGQTAERVVTTLRRVAAKREAAA